MGRVVIVHPFVQAYRKALYTALAARLAQDGRPLTVVWSTPPPRVAQRGDTVTAEWTQAAPNRWVTIAGRDIGYRRLSGLALTPDDLVIVEQAVKNLETFPLMLKPGRRPRVAMWGHGRTYSISQPPLVASAKQWLTRRADWFFAYTRAGAQHVVANGFPEERVTVVTNTIDTDGLHHALDDISAQDVLEFRAEHGLSPGRTALFLGGVDSAKGIDFLLASAERARRQLPDFVLVVAGSGALLPQVEAAQRAGAPVRALGRSDGPRKALALAAADVLAVPEWIGLVAVDALVAGVPVVSTHHHSHAPEAEYLVDGATCELAAHDVDAYAHALVGLLTDEDRRGAMSAACLATAPAYALDRTVAVFGDGIARWDATRG